MHSLAENGEYSPSKISGSENGSMLQNVVEHIRETLFLSQTEKLS
jgi:hypothetical protein